MIRNFFKCLLKKIFGKQEEPKGAVTLCKDCPQEDVTPCKDESSATEGFEEAWQRFLEEQEQIFGKEVTFHLNQARIHGESEEAVAKLTEAEEFLMEQLDAFDLPAREPNNWLKMHGKPMHRKIGRRRGNGR